jgi:hypothetical protein
VEPEAERVFGRRAGRALGLSPVAATAGVAVPLRVQPRVCPHGSRTPSAAGELTRRRLAEWGIAGPDVLAAELVVRELVTNGVRYGRPPLRLLLGQALTVEVEDGSAAGPYLRMPGPTTRAAGACSSWPGPQTAGASGTPRTGRLSGPN